MRNCISSGLNTTGKLTINLPGLYQVVRSEHLPLMTPHNTLKSFFLWERSLLTAQASYVQACIHIVFLSSMDKQHNSAHNSLDLGPVWNRGIDIQVHHDYEYGVSQASGTLSNLFYRHLLNPHAL